MPFINFCIGRDAALRCPRPERSGGRNERGKTQVFGGSFPSPDAALGDEDGAVHRPYQSFHDCLWTT